MRSEFGNAEWKAFLRELPPGERKKAYHQLREVRPFGPHKREWLHWWVASYWGVHIPNVKVCPDHDAPFTAFADAFFGESSKGLDNQTFLCHGSRLFGGKTYLAGLLAKTRMVLWKADVYILGGSEDQAKTMQEYIKGEHEQQIEAGVSWGYKRAPSHLLKSITATEVRLHNRGKAKAIPASQKATRGKHGTDLYVDELDECDYDVFKSALGQTYSRGDINTLHFFTSTWQHPDGSMTQAFDEAEHKGWGVYTWCYRETHERYGGHNTQEEIDRKRAGMTEADWNTEVELQRPESGDLIFSQDIIEFLFDEAMGTFTDKIGYEYQLIPPNEGDYFYTGADWAKKRDLTVIQTNIDNPTGPDTMAAFLMTQKEPYPVMMGQFNDRIRNYGGPAMFDGTGMAGDMIEDNLAVAATPFDFSRRNQLHQIYSSYINAIEKGDYVYPVIPYLRKQYSLLTRGQVYESTRVSKKNHTPDTFVAGALAREAQHAGTFELLLGRA